MRSPFALLLAVWALLACASQAPPTAQKAEANSFCTNRCEEDLGDEELYSCDVLCECVVDALADLYPDKDVATLLAMLDAGQQNSTPDLDQVGRDCALQSSLMPNSGLDPYLAAWYSKHLEAAGEPRIQPTGREDAEVYRLLVLPSFTSTIVVRVERLGDQITYTTKRLSGGGDEPGEIEWQADGTMPNAATSLGRRIAVSMTSSSLTAWPRVCPSASRTSATSIRHREEPMLDRAGATQLCDPAAEFRSIG
jgi:hypothetical protein